MRYGGWCFQNKIDQPIGKHRPPRSGAGFNFKTATISTVRRLGIFPSSQQVCDSAIDMRSSPTRQHQDHGPIGQLVIVLDTACDRTYCRVRPSRPKSHWSLRTLATFFHQITSFIRCNYFCPTTIPRRRRRGIPPDPWCIAEITTCSQFGVPGFRPPGIRRSRCPLAAARQA